MYLTRVNRVAFFASLQMIRLHPDISNLRQQRFKAAVWRDVLFLVGGAMAYVIVGYVETHAADDIRLKRTMQYYSNHDVCFESDSCVHFRSDDAQNKRVLDAGFILTTPIHAYLARNRDVNDVLAMLNSFFLAIPLAYVIYVTLWRGDFRLSFRLIATHLFRSLCGWFT